jgi:hypothetical protein
MIFEKKSKNLFQKTIDFRILLMMQYWSILVDSLQYDDSSCTWEKLHVLWFCVIAIYAPMIYMAPYVMFLMRADPLRGQVERVGPWKSRPFWAL